MTALVNTETGEIVETLLNYEVHPAATLFPLIEGAPFDAFVNDIRARGQEMPVVLDKDGRLLDGRNRARACQAIGIDVRETRYSGDDPFGFVISHNMQRRHLTESQRAMVAAKLANLRNGDNQFRQQGPSIDGPSVPAITTADAAKLLNVSPTTVERARLVRDHGTPETQAAVEAGQITVNAAATAIKDARKTKRVTEDPLPRVRPTDVRVKQITDLAARGATSEQIGKEVGISEQYVRVFARKHGIELHADKVRGKVRRIVPSEVLENVTTILETAASALTGLDASQLDREEALEAADSLTTSINALSKAVKKIKESFHE